MPHPMLIVSEISKSRESYVCWLEKPKYGLACKFMTPPLQALRLVLSANHLRSRCRKNQQNLKSGKDGP